MDDQQYQKLLEALEKFGAKTADFDKILGLGTKSGKDFQKEIEKLAKQVKAGTKGYADQKAKLEELDDALEKLTENSDKLSKKEIDAQRAVLLKTRAELQAAATIQGSMEDIATATTTAGKSLIQGAGSFVNKLQSNASANDIASGLFATAIDVTAAAFKGAGSIAEKFGDKMLQSANPIISTIGLLTSGIGAIVDASAEQAAKIAKFGVEVLQKEVEKTYTAFNQLSASGALFTDGMTGMRNAAGAAGLTVDQFAKVVSENTEALAQSGLGVTAGAKLIGGALSYGGANMKKQLLNLGVGFEEQAGLVAQVIKDMRGSTAGPLRASNQQVAEQTMKYAENLKIIASITGEDAKKKMEQVRQQASQLAFQQKLAQKTPEEQAAILRAMGNMNTLQRKNFMDMVNFGSVINTEGAAAASLSGGLRDSVSEAYQAFNEGNLDDARQRAINAKYNSQIQKDALDQTALGLAGAANVGGLAQGLAEAFGNMLQEVKAATPEAIKAAEEAAAAQKEATDGLTTAVTDAETAAQALKTALQEDLTNAIKDYSRISGKMLGAVEDMLDEIGYGSKKTAQQKLDKKLSNLDTGTREALKDYSKTMQKPNATLSEQAAAAQEIYGFNPAFALGGIAEGPLSGFSATLHGTEAVIPLPDGKTVPVNLDTSSITNAIMQQTMLLRELVSNSSEQKKYASRLLQLSY